VPRRKPNRIVLFLATNPLAPDTNAIVDRAAFHLSSELQEEDAYVQKLLNLADSALSAWSKPDRRKLA
jgi:hypothetical protein